jgi:hypothetical protein
LTFNNDNGPDHLTLLDLRTSDTRFICRSYGVDLTAKNAGCAKQEIDARPKQKVSDERALFGRRGESDIKTMVSDGC